MASVRDRSESVDNQQIILFRQASIEKHVALLRSLSRTVLTLSQRAIRQEHSGLDEIAIRAAIVASYYDSTLAERFLKYLQLYSNQLKGVWDNLNDLDLFQALIPVVELFERLNIAYHIGGSFASSAHGVPRATADLDLMADISMEHVQALLNELQSAYYIEELSVKRAIRNRTEFNLIHNQTIIKIDIFIPKDRAYDREAMQRAVLTPLEAENPRNFYIKSSEDIILTKLEWYQSGGCVSENQWRDIAGVIKVRANSLDYHYLNRWAVELGLTDLLTRALAEAGIDIDKVN
jgi:hypothetical protein